MRTNLIKPKNISEAKSKTSNDGMLDMVIAFDTTGSMAGCISMLNTSDQYEKEVKVTREDKKDGTPGIRTIFEGIRSSEVFTVVFKKQDKAKTKKQFESEKEAQRMEATSIIDKAKR